MRAKTYKKILSDQLLEMLSPLGFKRKGSNFHFSNNELDYFISLQSSQSSTAQVFKATLNIEIASQRLAMSDTYGMPAEHIRHYSRRAGSFMCPSQDKWWVISDDHTLNAVVIELTGLMKDQVPPLLEAIRATKDLVMLWQQGQCPGLTEKQRQHYLGLYNSLAKDK